MCQNDFLLVSGKPIEEPVAWYGPIVMNYPGELRQAMAVANVLVVLTLLTVWL